MMAPTKIRGGVPAWCRTATRTHICLATEAHLGLAHLGGRLLLYHPMEQPVPRCARRWGPMDSNGASLSTNPCRCDLVEQDPHSRIQIFTTSGG